MADGFDFLARASASAGPNDADNAGNDFLNRFGAVDISSGDGSSGGSGSGSASGNDDFDPAIHVGRDRRNADGSYTRKRGRRAGTSGGSSRPTVSRSTSSVKAIQNSLEGIHALIAAATGFDDIRLTQDESEPLAQAVAEVAKHYPIPVVDPKIMAIGGLLFTVAKIHGPKVALVKMQMDERAKERKQRARANTVVPIRPGIEIPTPATDRAPEPDPNFQASFIDMPAEDPTSFGMF